MIGGVVMCFYLACGWQKSKEDHRFKYYNRTKKPMYNTEKQEQFLAHRKLVNTALELEQICKHKN